MTESPALHIVCPHCHTTNRVQAAQLGSAPDSGSCHKPLFTGAPLELDAAGCPAPLPLAEVVMPDLILTPLLAFDDQGGRLGQGGGYYDRTFAALPDAIRIGFAYAGQRVERLALEPHDIRLHGVLTETGYTAFE